ncbi:hypothetical protein cypCar_00002630 [Cyprinus carpio]|nr:hypothetical protein cypCar_00002630 [Cyprinus carpio]
MRNMASHRTDRTKNVTSDAGDVSKLDLLLHPELLSQEFIQLMLRERKIAVGGEEDRERLTDLYLRHVVPLPQRDLPSSRWGRRMERSRARQRTPVSSPGAGPKSPCNHSKTANSSVHSNNTTSKLKRTSPSDGEPNTSKDIKSPDAKKKIQHITWP